MPLAAATEAEKEQLNKDLLVTRQDLVVKIQENEQVHMEMFALKEEQKDRLTAMQVCAVFARLSSSLIAIRRAGATGGYEAGAGQPRGGAHQDDCRLPRPRKRVRPLLVSMVVISSCYAGTGMRL